MRDEVNAAIDNSFLVLRNRIDRFGVVQPNIQRVEGQSGRIMIELPGIKEPERVRKLLQGSANLEFWETYDTQVALPYLNQLNTALRNSQQVEEGTEDIEVAESETAEVAETETAEVAESTEVAEVAETTDTTANEENLLEQVASDQTPAIRNTETDEAAIAKA